MYRTILALSALGVIALAPRSRAAEPIDFQRDIRPILADNCFTCHGFDDKARKGKLRLDIREDALRGGTSGDPAIVPGKVDAGQLIARIISNEAEEVMPPPSTKKKLTPLQIEKLRQWVASGAEYKLHWGFIAPKRSPIPNVNHATFTIRNPIDAFVMARLRREKMEPSPEVDRVTLIRRLSLDLIGLPPTIEEVDEFVNDRSADAYEKLVDRLLASPHYGERWGRHWLDAARYADSDGYEKDKPRNVWMYRDWVVNAHNHDLAYDQFLTDQLAGARGQFGRRTCPPEPGMGIQQDHPCPGLQGSGDSPSQSSTATGPVGCS